MLAGSDADDVLLRVLRLEAARHQLKDHILEIETADEDVVLARLYLTASTGSTSADGVITAYFDSAHERDAAMEVLRDVGEVRAIDRERVDWLERYQQSLAPLFIGERFVVAPDAS